ncbi:hypothetical protein BDQ17DRAFT_1302696, partial [Cyathus striatus]
MESHSTPQSVAQAFQTVYVTANNSEINVVGRDQYNFNTKEKGMQILQKLICVSATVNSGSHRHSTCAEGTREDILSEIRNWKENSDDRLMWILGPAGYGKYSIMQTLVNECEENGSWSASFFSRENETEMQNTANSFFSTIAYELATKIPQLEKEIEKAVESDTVFQRKSLEYQFSLLIKKPLMATTPGIRSRVIIFIDALDECTKEDERDKIISLVGIAASTLGINFLITSRNDDSI